jgi:hypothetical protein
MTRGSGKIATNALDQFGRAQTLWTIASFVLPPGLTVAAVWSSIARNLPAPSVIETAAVVFASATLSVYLIYQLWNLVTPKHKLRYIATVVLRDLVSEQRRARRATATGAITQRHLEAVQVGVQLHNVSHFPISAFVESAETQMEGLTPPREQFPRKPTTILPGNQVFMVDGRIDMEGMASGRIEGRMDIVIRYGYPGAEDHKLHFTAGVTAFLRQDGLVESTYTQWDSNQF